MTNADRPLCAGRLRVGPGQEQAPVGDVGVAGPDLVAVDDVVVARRGRRVVVSEARSEPAPGSLKPWHQRSVPSIMPGRKRRRSCLAPVPAESLHQVAEAGPGRRAGQRQFLVEDDVVDRAAARARRTRGARTGRRSRPRTAPGATRPGGPSTRPRPPGTSRPARPARHAAGRGRPPRRASHDSPQSISSDADLLEAHAEQLRRGQRPPQVDVGQALPGVADAAVHLDGRLADVPGGARAVDLRDPRGPDGLGPGAARRRPRPRAAARSPTPRSARGPRPAGARRPGRTRSPGRTGSRTFA